MEGSSRGAFLRRAGIGALGVLSVGAASALADSSSDQDLANVRLVTSCKLVTINWYTRWLDTPSATETAPTALVAGIRKQEEAHYKLLAPLLGATAPTNDDYTFAFPRSALRSTEAATAFSLKVERLVAGIGVEATATTTNQGVAEALARVTASDWAHVSALGGLSGHALAPSLPAPVDVVSASTQLAQYLH